MDKSEEFTPEVYNFLILQTGQQITQGKPLLNSDQKVWLIVFEPARAETETDQEADVDVQSTVPAKFLIYPEEARDALRGGDEKKEVSVYEVFADKVLVSSRAATATSILLELKEFMGGDEVLRAAAQTQQQSAPVQPAG